MPGISTVTAAYPRLLGIAAKVSLSIVRVVCELCTSTTGDSPLTVIVSVNAPTRRSALIVATKFPSSATLSRLKVLKPLSVKVTA